VELDLGSIFKNLIWDLMIKQVIADALAWLPLGVAGPFGLVVTRLILLVSNNLYGRFEILVKLDTIILKNDVHQKFFENAQFKLKILAKEKGIDSQEFKNERTKMADDLWDLTRVNVDPLKLRIGNNP
jgi:hypothetical protein